MTDKHSLPPPQRRVLTPYVMIWAVLATLSLAYLAILFTQPRTVAKFMGGPAGMSEEDMRTLVTAASEIPYLRDSARQARMDIDEIKAEREARADRDRELIERVAALEARPQEPAKSSDAAPPAGARAVGDKRADRQPVKPSARLPQETNDNARPMPSVAVADDTPGTPSRTTTAALPPKPTKKPAKPASGDAADNGLVTGSVGSNAPPVSFGEADVIPANSTPPRTYGLQVGRAPSIESLRVIWGSLSATHSESLGALQPRYVAGSDPASGDYDLVAGPVASAVEAKRLCKELTLKGTPCKVSDFTGNAF